MSILIKDALIVDPFSEREEKGDLLIEGEKIKEVFDVPEELTRHVEKVIHAKNLVLMPGLIDMHVHFREPGYEYKEDIETGSRAAISGGFTAVCCMPNTKPVNDNRGITEYIIQRAEEVGLCHVYPICAITPGQKGEGLTEFGELQRAGAVAASDDGRPVERADIMRRAMEYAMTFDFPIISHCEELSLSKNGVMNEGWTSTRLGLHGIPGEAEEVMVAREILLSKLTGCPIHIAHVSTKGSVSLIKRAKEDGLKITAEATPHHFSLTEEAVLEYNTLAKVNPPLRTEEDVKAIRDALKQGIIDVIASDHAPHSILEKEVEFDRAENGMIGLETTIPLSFNLFREGYISLIELAKKLSYNPAKILKLEGGKLAKEEWADITIIDPGLEWELKEEEILSKSKNSPFIGYKLKGRAVVVIVKGKILLNRLGN